MQRDEVSRNREIAPNQTRKEKGPVDKPPGREVLGEDA
jgi:hypothetical protein